MSCKGCTKRYVGCHSSCEDYKETQKRHAERRQKEHSMVTTPYSAKTYRKLKRSEGRLK